MIHSLEVESLKKYFGDYKAVDDISFHVQEGEFFSILGPSGCGKTTLLRMIAGFLKPSSGSIQIGGVHMTSVAPNKRPVNLVFQNLALFPMMDVGENIAFGLKRQNFNKSQIDEKVKKILQKVRLEGYERKSVASLSGGQKQRVAIARSLILEPAILLLDEPLGALDLKLREQMKIELKKLQNEFGTTFVYITHDQSEALVMSDKVAVMNAGKFEQIDTPKNLYENPQTSFVASFVGETNRFEADIIDGNCVQIQDGVRFKVAMTEKNLHNKCSLFIRPEAITLLVDDGMEEMNYFDLQIKTILFDGSNTKVLANFAQNNHEIMVSLPQNRRYTHIKEGDTIKAGVHVSDCKCYE